MSEYIINPKTGRKIKADGKVAKSLLFDTQNSYQGPCPDHYVMNPITGRCNKDKGYFPDEYQGVCPEFYVFNSKTGRCIKEKKSPGKMTNYNMFVKQIMPEIKAQYPNLTPQQRMKVIGQRWSSEKV